MRFELKSKTASQETLLQTKKWPHSGKRLPNSPSTNLLRNFTVDEVPPGGPPKPRLSPSRQYR